MTVSEPNEDYPLEALRDCMFCGNDRKNIKIMHNTLNNCGYGLEVCDRYCMVCHAKVPIRVWDGTDPKCVKNDTTDELPVKSAKLPELIIEEPYIVRNPFQRIMRIVTRLGNNL